VCAGRRAPRSRTGNTRQPTMAVAPDAEGVPSMGLCGQVSEIGTTLPKASLISTGGRDGGDSLSHLTPERRRGARIEPVLLGWAEYSLH